MRFYCITELCLRASHIVIEIKGKGMREPTKLSFILGGKIALQAIIDHRGAG